MTLCRRPDYTKQVLSALSLCQGIKDYLLIMSIDGDNEKVAELADSFSSCKKKILRHKRYGLDKNTYYVLTAGFSHSDYVIHLEDDTVPAHDTLRYFEWARDYSFRPDVISISAYNRNGSPKYGLRDITIRQSFNPWGWAMSINRWYELRTQWVHNKWDSTCINKHGGIKLKSVYPRISRIQNIGAKNAVHVRSEAWHKRHHYVNYWAGDLPKYNDEYLFESDVIKSGWLN